MKKEYASSIMNAILAGEPAFISGNVLNIVSITNLPYDTAVEITCLADKTDVQPIHVGVLSTQLTALNQTHINVNEFTIEATVTKNQKTLSSSNARSAYEFIIDVTRD